MTKDQAWEVMQYSLSCGDDRQRDWTGRIRCDHDYCAAWTDSWYVYFDRTPSYGAERWLLILRFWLMETGLYSGRGLLDWFMNWLWDASPYDKFIYAGWRK